MNDRILSEIWRYPVKSLGGEQISAGRILPKGLEYDRRWMLTDTSMQFLTQRTVPELALFRARIGGNDLVVQHNEHRIHVPIEARHGDLFQATVWADTVQVHGCSSDADTWFSDLLHRAVRLVAFPEKEARQVDLAYSARGQWVSLADGYPFLVIGEASLADLNARLEQPVPMNRFRPNFVFTGMHAYEEDGWKKFGIGAVDFVGVKPCARCVMTTVDQATGRKNTEPLATLAGYRKRGGQVYFGQNVLPCNVGTVAVGDAILINE